MLPFGRSVFLPFDFVFPFHTFFATMRRDSMLEGVPSGKTGCST